MERAASISQRAQTVIDRCLELATHTEVPGRITRRFLAPPMHAVHACLRSWMEAAGMAVTVDAAGNLRGLSAAADPMARRILLGSHLDTVPDAGAYDGILGVVLAIAAVEELCALRAIDGQQLPHAIEVIGFSEEEGVRFGKPFLGSLAVVGSLDEQTLALPDAGGTTVAEAIRAFGLDPGRVREAELEPAAAAYLEVHIEQGPLLEAAARDHDRPVLGVVDSILGQTRIEVTFCGRASHAGTTPMRMRRDALAAAAEWITCVERIGNQIPGLVATVGRLEVSPGATNVIAGSVCASLDVRHANDAIRQSTVETLLQQARIAGEAREVRLMYEERMNQPAVAMDACLCAQLSAAVIRCRHVPLVLSSGAGHDAMVLATRVPAAMLFLPTPGGIGHHPDESVRVADVSAALETVVEFLRRFSEDQTHA